MYLRVTEYNDKPIPVLEVQAFEETWGMLYGPALRRCLPVIRSILSRVCDDAGIPLEHHRHFTKGSRIKFRGNLPLDNEASAKLSLIFKLQDQMEDMDRVELIARRVERFSREEAMYWLTRITQYGITANNWALTGMRIMLGGQPEDKAVTKMLEKLRI